MKLPSRWRPLARRRAIADAKRLQEIEDGIALQHALGEISDHGTRPIPLGVITREHPYMRGMDPRLADFLNRRA